MCLSGFPNGIWRGERIPRVVTFDGELFETSGTMSGGGNKSKSGGIGTSIRESVSEEAIRNAENDLNNIVEELNGLRVKVNDARKRYQSLEGANSRLEMELAKARKEVSIQQEFCLSFTLVFVSRVPT